MDDPLDAGHNRKRAATPSDEGSVTRRPAPGHNISPAGLRLTGPVPDGTCSRPGLDTHGNNTVLELDAVGNFVQPRHPDRWEAAVAAHSGPAHKPRGAARVPPHRCARAVGLPAAAGRGRPRRGDTGAAAALAQYRSRAQADREGALALHARHRTGSLRPLLRRVLLRAAVGPRLKHSEAIVGQVKESFAATTKDWPQTPLGGPALLALAEHTRSTLLAFLKTMAGTISRGIIRVADVPGHRRRDR